MMGVFAEPKNWLHGFQSLEVYRIWFVTPTVRAAIYNQNVYHMRVYDVPDTDYKQGMVQVTFNPDAAISVRIATKEEMS